MFVFFFLGGIFHLSTIVIFLLCCSVLFFGHICHIFFKLLCRCGKSQKVSQFLSVKWNQLNQLNYKKSGLDVCLFFLGGIFHLSTIVIFLLCCSVLFFGHICHIFFKLLCRCGKSQKVSQFLSVKWHQLNQLNLSLSLIILLFLLFLFYYIFFVLNHENVHNVLCDN